MDDQQIDYSAGGYYSAACLREIWKKMFWIASDPRSFRGIAPFRTCTLSNLVLFSLFVFIFLLPMALISPDVGSYCMDKLFALNDKLLVFVSRSVEIFEGRPLSLFLTLHFICRLHTCLKMFLRNLPTQTRQNPKRFFCCIFSCISSIWNQCLCGKTS